MITDKEHEKVARELAKKLNGKHKVINRIAFLVTGLIQLHYHVVKDLFLCTGSYFVGLFSILKAYYNIMYTLFLSLFGIVEY